MMSTKVVLFHVIKAVVSTSHHLDKTPEWGNLKGQNFFLALSFRGFRGVILATLWWGSHGRARMLIMVGWEVKQEEKLAGVVGRTIYLLTHTLTRPYLLKCLLIAH